MMLRTHIINNGTEIIQIYLRDDGWVDIEVTSLKDPVSKIEMTMEDDYFRGFISGIYHQIKESKKGQLDYGMDEIR